MRIVGVQAEGPQDVAWVDHVTEHERVLAQAGRALAVVRGDLDMERLQAGRRLLHEVGRRLPAFQGHRDRGADGRMAREGDLATDRPDPVAVAGARGGSARGRGLDERRLGQAQTPRQLCHLRIAHAVRVEDDGVQVALQRALGEHVEEMEWQSGHGRESSRQPWPVMAGKHVARPSPHGMRPRDERDRIWAGRRRARLATGGRAANRARGSAYGQPAGPPGGPRGRRSPRRARPLGRLLRTRTRYRSIRLDDQAQDPCARRLDGRDGLAGWRDEGLEGHSGPPSGMDTAPRYGGCYDRSNRTSWSQR